MHIQNCEHPKRVYNKYTKEFCYVPCGKCPSCLKSRVNKWIERLNAERKCWKYCVFFTLTYAPEFVPVLKKLGSDFLVDLTHLHQAKDQDSPVINLNDIFFKLSPSEKTKLQSYLQKNDEFTYLSVYDAQCFIKRLRKNLYNEIKNRFSDYDQKDYQVRYYLTGEYGETLFRSHYHGLLFFSSQKEAACIEDCIRKSWKFGITDSSFVAESNASYLAKYVNSVNRVPPIYLHESIRPFSIFSKSVPIGTLYFNEEQIQEIFYAGSPKMLVDYFKGKAPQNVSLWRTYQDRLFPKLPGYSNLSNYDRVTLYRAYGTITTQWQREMTSPEFVEFMLEHHNSKRFTSTYLHCYDDYISFLMDRATKMAVIPSTVEIDSKLKEKHFLNSLKLWHFVSSRVTTQAAAFDISVNEYLEYVDLYYNNLEKDRLIGYFDFQREYAKEHKTRDLVGLDRLWLESVLDIPYYLLSMEEQNEYKKVVLQLEGFDVDITKFFSPDDEVRQQYQELLLPYNTRDYQSMVLDNSCWLRKATKNKIKNDYLSAHPEDLLKVSDYVPF